MRKWLWIAPMLVVAGCSKNPAAKTQAPAPEAATPVGSAQAAKTQAAQTQAALPVPAVTPQPDPPPPPAPPAAAATDPAPTPGVLIPRGTLLRVRVDAAISTRRNHPGDRFTATLTDPVVVGGKSVLPSGTRLAGRVLVSSHSGRMKGRARLVLALDSFERDGHRYRIDTTAASRVSASHKRRNLVAIGGGAGTGAAIGAIAGGGVGAAVGAGVGAAAGTVGAAVTGRKQVTIPAESVVRFTLGAPVRV